MTPEIRKILFTAALIFLWLLQLLLILIHFLHGILKAEYWKFVGEDQNILGDAVSVVFGGLDLFQGFLPAASVVFAVAQLVLSFWMIRHSLVPSRVFPGILLLLTLVEVFWIRSWKS